MAPKVVDESQDTCARTHVGCDQRRERGARARADDEQQEEVRKRMRKLKVRRRRKTLDEMTMQLLPAQAHHPHHGHSLRVCTMVQWGGGSVNRTSIRYWVYGVNRTSIWYGELVIRAGTWG